jgi:vacuolar-type H+-ATPase catalytic subunit A/Vma1
MSCILQGVLDALFPLVLGGTCALLDAFEYGKIMISQALSKVIVCHWWVIYCTLHLLKEIMKFILAVFFLKIVNIVIILDQVFAENT